MDSDYRNDFSDMSDRELIEASQIVKQLQCSYVVDADLQRPAGSVRYSESG